MMAIEIHNLSKSYGKVQALKNVSFEVRRGELFGLIGPDGAGKTTLFRLLATLLNPDSGSAVLDGFDIVKDYQAVRSRVGYMPGRFSLYPDLSVEENLQFFAALFGVTVAESYSLVAPIYKQIELFRKRRAGKLSGGMKQKLALSCALIHRPSVLLLDEPTTGVDAVSRCEFWDMLAELRRHGLTILVSTPYMDEAVRCDRVALCDEGGILKIDTPEGIVNDFDSVIYGVKAKSMLSLLEKVRLFSGVADCYPFGEWHHMVTDDDFDVSDFLSVFGCVDGFEFIPVSPTIEDVFIKLMKR